MIVADTNLLVYLLLPGERTEEAEAVFERDPDWAAPLLWRSELRNVLATYGRRGALELAVALEIMADAERFMAGREYAVPFDAVLRIASGSDQSAYDCELVVLARDLGVPLITTDRALERAFPEVAVPPMAFA